MGAGTGTERGERSGRIDRMGGEKTEANYREAGAKPRDETVRTETGASDFNS